MKQKLVTGRQQTDSETKDIDRKTNRQTVKQKIVTGRQTDRQ